MILPEFPTPPPSGGDRVTRMIRADIDLRAFYRWAGARGMISRNVFDPGFAMHCLLVESFGDNAPKPFRISMPRGRSRTYGTLYGYSYSGVEELRMAALTFACPLQSQVLPASRIDGKPMPTSWRKGLRLGFEILIRPVVRCARGSENAGRERDAFQAEAERHPKGRMKRNREEVYSNWLSDRLGRRGARLEEARLISFQRVRVVRKLRWPASEGPEAVMRGSIIVTEPSQFTDLVARGIGRHRAYGYGMVLLRPALSPPRD